MPEIRSEDLSDPVQFKVKYEMEPFGFEVRKTDLSAGLYTAMLSAAGALILDSSTYGLNDSLVAFPVHKADKALNGLETSLNEWLMPGLHSTSSHAPGAETAHAGAASANQHKAFASAMTGQVPQPPSLEQRAGAYAGVTAFFAFGAVALLSGLRYGELLRRKHFKANKAKVEALEAACANTISGSKDKPD